MTEEKNKELTLPPNVLQLFEPQHEEEESLDIAELFWYVLSKWKLILCIAIILAILAGAYTMFLVTPVYRATSTIYILSRSDSAINMSDLQLGTALAKDYLKIFRIWEIHEQVIEELNLPYSYQQMQGMISVTNEDGTRMIDITATTPSAKLSADVANTYAEVVRQYIADTMSVEAPSIVSVALEPGGPSNGNITTSLVGGFAAGVALAVILACVMYFSDDKIKTPDDIKKYTGLINLAVVPINTAGQTKTRGKTMGRGK